MASECEGCPNRDVGEGCCLEDPCEICPDRHLDDEACCGLLPGLPRVLPRRLRRARPALDLLEAKYQEPAIRLLDGAERVRAPY